MQGLFILQGPNEGPELIRGHPVNCLPTKGGSCKSARPQRKPSFWRHLIVFELALHQGLYAAVRALMGTQIVSTGRCGAWRCGTKTATWDNKKEPRCQISWLFCLLKPSSSIWHESDTGLFEKNNPGACEIHTMPFLAKVMLHGPLSRKRRSLAAVQPDMKRFEAQSGGKLYSQAHGT